MKRLLIVLMALVMSVFGFSAAVSAAPSANGSAAAPAATSDCAAGDVCFWSVTGYVNGSGNVNGPGHLSGTNASWFDFSHANCPNGTWADCAMSIWNHGRSCTARVWYLRTDQGFPSNPHLDIAANLSTVPVSGISGVSWARNIEANSWVSCTS
jgi:hypothetical protein